MNGPPRNDEYDHITVYGAGEIEIGELGQTMNATGVSFGVSWGRHAYATGVIDEEDIRRLINILQSRLNDIEENRSELADRLRQRGLDNLANQFELRAKTDMTIN